MRYIVAVSGGVDSVALLHKLVTAGKYELVVTHFDHGIRPHSDADARFVHALAKQYGLLCVIKREELGANASEATARARRYAFLREVATAHDGVIVTAHHGDDLIETIAINLTRGTGWRGLAVFGNHDIARPLLAISKQDIYDYALLHRLEWVEDETNSSDVYLRNRLRRKIHTLVDTSTREQLTTLWRHQRELSHAIDSEQTSLMPRTSTYSRYFFTHIDATVSQELLRFATKQTITRPQAERALHAIKTAQAGSVCEVSGTVRLKFSQRDFTIQTP